MSKNSSLGDTFGAKIYLIFYNFLQFLGWSYCFYIFILEVKTLQLNSKRLYNKVHIPLIIFQTLQLIEVLHSIIGLVKSNPLITLEQIFSRIIIVWAILLQFPSSRLSYGLHLIVASWSLAEITRYLYYAFNIIKLVPYFLTWCRYSFFLILYPCGVMGELLILWSSLKEVSTKSYLNYSLPNNLNISLNFSYFLIGIMLLYIPLFPPLYFHLINQRIKIIGNQSSKTKVY